MVFAIPSTNSNSFDSSIFHNDRLFDDMIEDDIGDGLYCPDFTVTRRPKNHTTTRVMGYDIYEQPNLSIQRPPTDNGLLPITEIDDLFGDGLTTYCQQEITLSKRDLFLSVQDALDTFATTMKKTYDVNTNMDTRVYTVPIIGFLDIRTKSDDTFGTNSAYFQKSSYRTTKKHDIPEPRERFIIIDGDTYSKWNTYKRHGGKYVPLNIPADFDKNLSHFLNENEQTFRVSNVSNTKSGITITLPKETELSGLSLHPEEMRFEQIHSTTIHCHGNCTKAKHCISCLKNDPGYLITFKMFIRSSLTDGQWLSLGTFAGNNSIYDSTRISFDSILVKEIKIVPLNYNKSFDKIRLFPIGPSISSASVSDDVFVTYTLMTPRDGKYLKHFDKTIDKKRYTIGCNCGLCNPTRNGKGTYKEKCRNMRDVYDM
jgi:hypothetical protein